MKVLKKFGLALALAACLAGLLSFSGIFEANVNLLVFVLGCTGISLIYGELLGVMDSRKSESASQTFN